MKILCTLFAVAALALLPMASAENRNYAVTGIVRELRPENTVVIQHEEIPGFMAAMTMPFTLGKEASRVALKPGDEVRFVLRMDDGDALITDLHVVRPGTVKLPAATAGAPARRLKPGHEVPAFRLVNENGASFGPETFRGRFTLITFIFTRCPVPQFCPAMNSKFQRVQELLEESSRTDVHLLSITLDPEFDQPAILSEFGKALGAQPGLWSFGTGDKDEVEALAKAFSVFTEKQGAILDHTLCTALIGPDGRVVELWRGNTWSPDEIIQAAAQK